jgi:hypothetical protein
MRNEKEELERFFARQPPPLNNDLLEAFNAEESKITDMIDVKATKLNKNHGLPIKECIKIRSGVALNMN